MNMDVAHREDHRHEKDIIDRGMAHREDHRHVDADREEGLPWLVTLRRLSLLLQFGVLRINQPLRKIGKNIKTVESRRNLRQIRIVF